MKALLIFDQKLDLDKLKAKLSLLKPGYTALFPLTSQWSLIHEVEKLCQLNINARIELMESAKLINNEVEPLRQKASKWSAQLGEYKIGARSIKEWFLLPEGTVSTWWFSSLSEKNTLKTNAFFNIARIAAIDKVISSGIFDICIVSTNHNNLSLALEALCQRHLVDLLYLSDCEKKPVFYLISRTMKGLGVSLLKAILAKLIMPSIKNRLKKTDNSILFISYFPYVDEEQAKKGRLKNIYAFALQEKITQMQRKIIWIWMYDSNSGYSFPQVCKLAARFTKSGEVDFFLEEFMSLKPLIRSLWLWLNQVRVFATLKKKIPDSILYKDFSIPESAIFIKDLMLDSFVGWTGLEGILYFELYKEIFSHFSILSRCIYYCEMQAWEKALNAAKKIKADKIKTIGFQHASVPENYFQYFHYPSEMPQGGNSSSLPLPDILVCNGDIPLGLIAQSRYPNIKKVEAVRHLYLASCLNELYYPDKAKAVLIAGSIDKEETKALILLFYEAFPKPKGFKVWLKAHPSLPLKEILEELKISDDVGYEIKNEPIGELLKLAGIVLVGSSSVALEALALGCKLILPVFPNYMFISPLIGFEQFYTKVYNPAQLKEIVEKIIESGQTQPKERHDVIDFISRYWCLDKSLQRWEEVLS